MSIASFHLDYKVVTQVYSCFCCDWFLWPISVAEMVCQQVGFEILFLDSKWFPIYIAENDTTAFIDFWKYYRIYWLHQSHSTLTH